MKRVSGVYLMQRGGGECYYVGQTKSLEHRYGPSDRREVVLFIEEDDTAERAAVEKEAIEFCSGVGLPLCNVHHNEKRYRGLWSQWKDRVGE